MFDFRDKAMDDNQIFTVSDLANRYRVTTQCVRRWIRAGFFPGAEKVSPYRNSPHRIPASAVAHFEELKRRMSETL